MSQSNAKNMLPSSTETSSSSTEDSSKIDCSKIGDYSIIREIGSGSFGKVYLAFDLKGERVAMKTEHLDASTPRLRKESQIYSLLIGVVGYPRVHWFGQEEQYTLLVMDAMGPSLEHLFLRCGRRFSLKTVLMLTEQLMNRVEFLHSKYFLHRDIKPANFVMGPGHYNHIVHMIDFGLSERFCDYTMKHTPNKSRYGVGTPLFSSVNTHYKNTPSRRDDMESLALMLIFFLKGSLPWEGVKGRKVSQTWDKIADKKRDTPVEELCEGIPDEFAIFLHYCRKLEYEEKPDYQFIRVMFRILGKKMGFEYDCEFDWVKDDRDFVKIPPPQLSLELPRSTPEPTTENLESFTLSVKNLNLNQKAD